MAEDDPRKRTLATLREEHRKLDTTIAELTAQGSFDQLEVKRLLELHQSKGWTVVLDDEEAEIAVRGCLPTGAVDPDAANPLLRHTLLALDLGGIIRIKSTPGDGPPDARIESVMIVVPARDEAPLHRRVVPRPSK